jgi:hypothetical protein
VFALRTTALSIINVINAYGLLPEFRVGSEESDQDVQSTPAVVRSTIDTDYRQLTVTYEYSMYGVQHLMS